MDSAGLLADFRRALDQFRDALRLPVENDVVKAGCIQYFEFTFELAWKTVKRIAEDEGLSDCNSPKAAMRIAFGNGWVDGEDIWLDMLSSRNRMAHTYQAAEAIRVFDRLPAYAEAFQALADKLVLVVG